MERIKPAILFIPENSDDLFITGEKNIHSMKCGYMVDWS